MKKAIKYILLLVLIVMISSALYALILRHNNIVPKAEVKAKFTQPSSHFLHWRGAEVHYTDEGQGIPVLMIHGFGGSFLNWNKLRDRMKGDYRVIRLDLPGFGMSDLPQSSNYVQQYRDFMTFFLDTLHLDSVYIIGNSMGGMMSWGATADHPDKVKKLILIASAGYDLEKISTKVAFLLKLPFVDLFLKKGFAPSFSEGNARKVFFDPQKINPQAVKNNNIMWNRQGNILAACAIASSANYPDTGAIAKIQCPTLIIWGKQDKIVPVEHAGRFCRDIKSSQLVLLDKCGHCPMIELPDTTALLIKSFFTTGHALAK